MVEVKKLATVVNQQNNPNYRQRETWSSCEKALSWGDDAYASSHFTRTDNLTNHPWTLTAHKFNLNLPSDGFVTKVKFSVRMRISENVDVDMPSALFCIYGSKPTEEPNENYRKTGWRGGLYIDGEPTPSTKLSTTWKTYTYEMDVEDLIRGGYTIDSYNSTIMGVDLRFNDANIDGDGDYSFRVDVAHVFTIIEYVKPKHNINFVWANSNKKAETELLTEDGFRIDIVYTQTEADARGGTLVLDVNLPWGCEILYEPDTNGTSTFDKTTCKWTLDANGKRVHILHLALKSHVAGFNTITVTNEVVGTYKYDYYVGRGVDEGFDGITLALEGVTHKNHKNGVYVNIEGYSSDSTVSYTISDDKSYRLIGWSIVDSTDSVSIDSGEDTDTVTLNVPASKRFTAYLKCSFAPKVTGKHTISVSSGDTGHLETLAFDVEEPYEYHVSNALLESETEKYYQLTPHTTTIKQHRIITDVDTNTSVIPFSSDEGDSVMYVSDCSLKVHEVDEMDYIGCVRLEQTHFNQESTYKDTLINTNYKNNKYLGKKLAPDEDIKLNVRLHPHQVTTVQGLINMDKPIPINTNHKSFEGDALNNRGWAEIYSIKTKYTNPHWYKCEIGVEYLTHNLKTRFNIIKGNAVNTYPISSLMAPVFTSGDSLSTSDNYFITDTDGTYTYVEGVDKTLRNVFNINNGQHINIKSRNKLASITRVSFEWNSAILSEVEENNISRIVRLLDETGNPVFEYEYTGFEYIYDNTETNPSLDRITASVIYRVLTENGWEDYSDEVTLRSEISNNGVLAYSDDETVDVSGVIETESEMLYGSTLHLMVNNHKLEIVDEGFNGREVYTQNSLDLEGENYTWETEWINKNTTIENNTYSTYFDFNVDETLLDSEFATKYSKCIVSPFPIPNKRLLFIRDAEEGAIYYYEDDGEEFSYLVDPYYQYHNGTDLISSDNISILNMNYDYDIVYIQNGLVRLGFNRLNGQLYLGKYDSKSHTYVTTHHFSLEKYSDINLKSISDDKIEIQSSDSIFTIWRGHPYVMITHPTEDINILSSFSKVWCEGVNSDISEYPQYYDLLNESNILPPCVGGVKDIKSSCLDVYDETITRTSTSLAWTNDFDDIYTDTNKTFSVSGTLTDPTDIITSSNGNTIFGSCSVNLQSFNGSLVITKRSGNLVIKIKSNITSALKLKFKRNGTFQSAINSTYSDNVHTWTIPLSNFSINDELSEFTVFMSGTHNLSSMNEGVTLLIDGEVIATLSSNNYTTKFMETGEHTMQAVYKGNDKYMMACTPQVTFMVQQSTDPSQSNQYKLEFVDKTVSKFKYKDNQMVEFLLTQGGVPLGGETVEIVLPPPRNIDSAETKIDGTVATYNTDWGVGTHLLRAFYYVNSIVKAIVQKEIVIEKNNASITYPSRTFSKGEYIAIHFADPLGDKLVGAKASIYINGKAYSNTTDSNGDIKVRFAHTGTFNFKVVFNGNENLKSTTVEFTKTISD